MQTSGHGNDALMILVPVGVAVVVSTILLGGPADALKVVEAMLGELAGAAMAMVSALF